MGIARAFDNVAELVAAPDVDLVAVTVRVPHHYDIVKTVISAGKHVYCEWPLGNGLAQAEELARLAGVAGVLGVVGTQARFAPEIIYLRQLIEDGYVGEILSSTLVARGMGWGGSVPVEKTGAYLLDRANGATMLTIPFGHTMAAVRDVLGEIAELAALLAVRRKKAVALDTGAVLSVTAPDQVLVSGLLERGAPFSVHYRGGAPRNGVGLVWEINGTEGDIRVTGSSGHSQLAHLSLSGGRGEDRALQPLEVPGSLLAGWPDDPVPGNVARIYGRLAADLRDGSRTAPSFDDAVAIHKVIAAMEEAAASGGRIALT